MTGPAGDSPQLPTAAAETAEDSVGRGAARTKLGLPVLLGAGAIACYLGVLAAAARGWAVALAVLLAATQPVDVAVSLNEYVRAVLARAQLGIATRTTVRELAALAAVVGIGWADGTDRRALATLVLAEIVLRLAFLLALVPVRRRAVGPVSTRNVDLAGLALPPAPPDVLLTRSAERVHGLSALAVVTAAIAVASSTPAVGYAGVGLVVALELLGVGYLGLLLVRGRRALSREQLLAAVADRVGQRRPTVMLYHSGDPDSAYQVNMWLDTVDRLPQECVVVLRERPVMRELAACTSPVLCIPDSVDFMTFSLPEIRVALYTANVGKTIHMLREPGVSHVFIGHGDSDKSASSNPFSKVYTQIWVAGPAGRDRYRRADIGIDDADIVEVGRPQLGGIDHFTGRVGEPLTVLYAPTWEGWTNDPAHTSLIRSGPALIERLVALPGVRVVYKPHPLTGSVSRAAAAADARMRATINRAGGAAGHRVAVGARPSLYECFNDADVLVADISSVLTDFVESQKPYVVVNVSEMPDEEFRRSFPSVSAAYLLDPSLAGLEATLAQICGADPMAAGRRDLKHYLLGADDPDAMTRFTLAVTTARDRAVTQCPVRPVLGATVG
jgi:hypothetical protein